MQSSFIPTQGDDNGAESLEKDSVSLDMESNFEFPLKRLQCTGKWTNCFSERVGSSTVMPKLTSVAKSKNSPCTLGPRLAKEAPRSSISFSLCDDLELSQSESRFASSIENDFIIGKKVQQEHDNLLLQHPGTVSNYSFENQSNLPRCNTITITNKLNELKPSSACLNTGVITQSNTHIKKTGSDFCYETMEINDSLDNSPEQKRIKFERIFRKSPDVEIRNK